MNSDRIHTRCPACRNDTLLLENGRLVCTWLDCPNPALIDNPPESIEAQLCALANENFERDLPSRLKKAGEEFSELAEAIANNDQPKIIEEAADLSFVLMDIVGLCGGTLSAAQIAKMKIVMERKAAGLLHKRDRIAKGLS